MLPIDTNFLVVFSEKTNFLEVEHGDNVPESITLKDFPLEEV